MNPEECQSQLDTLMFQAGENEILIEGLHERIRDLEAEIERLKAEIERWRKLFPAWGDGPLTDEKINEWDAEKVNLLTRFCTVTDE